MSDMLPEERIAQMRDDLASSKTEIIHHVTGLYSNNKENARFNLKEDPFHELGLIKNQVTDILELSKAKSANYKANEEEIKECSSMIAVLEKVSDISDKLMTCEEAINKLHLTTSCRLIGEIEGALIELPGPNTELGAGEVCSILRKESKMLKTRLMSKSRRLILECIKFDYGRIVVNKQLKGMIRSEDLMVEEKDAITMSDVWDTIVMMNKTEEIVDEMIRKLWHYLLRPLWKEKKAQSPRIETWTEDSYKEYLSIKGDDEAPRSFHRSELLFENIARDQTKTTDGSLHQPFGNMGTCRIGLSQLVSYLTQIFSFVHSEMLGGNEAVSQSLSVKLHSKPASIMTALIDAISLQLPKTEGDLLTYRNNLQEPCKDMEDRLSLFEQGRSPSPQETQTQTQTQLPPTPPKHPLTDFLSNLSSTYADIRRREILERARELVLSDYHNTMLATGDAAEDDVSSAGDIGDPKALLDQSGSFAIAKLKFYSCQTSLAVCRVLKLIHDVLKQACTASPKVTNVLFQSARDCLELFMAIVPMRFSDVIDTVPRMGAVFYNDCLYVAHNCTLISHKYHADLGKVDPILLRTAGFADFIPRFRTMGDACMTKHLSEQQATLLELVARIRINPEGEVQSVEKSIMAPVEVEIRPGGLLKGGLDLAGRLGTKLSYVLEKEAAPLDTVLNDEETAAVMVRHFERLSSQWLGVLQESIYGRLMGHLLEGVLQEVMRPLLVSEFICESSAVDITRVFRTLQRTRAVFPNECKEDDFLVKACPSWRKFLALTDLLEYSLSEVAEWLPRKKFSSFTGQEMTSLIKALFEDSSRRQGILSSILEMSS